MTLSGSTYPFKCVSRQKNSAGDIRIAGEYKGKTEYYSVKKGNDGVEFISVDKTHGTVLPAKG